MKEKIINASETGIRELIRGISNIFKDTDLFQVNDYINLFPQSLNDIQVINNSRKEIRRYSQVKTDIYNTYYIGQQLTNILLKFNDTFIRTSYHLKDSSLDVGAFKAFDIADVTSSLFAICNDESHVSQRKSWDILRSYLSYVGDVHIDDIHYACNIDQLKEVIEDEKECELAQHYLVFNNDFISHRTFKHEDLKETFIKTKEDWYVLDINVGYGSHEYFLHSDHYHHKYKKYLSIKSDGNNLMDYTLQPLTELLGENK
jgi:hypothetical protein